MLSGILISLWQVTQNSLQYKLRSSNDYHTDQWVFKNKKINYLHFKRDVTNYGESKSQWMNWSLKLSQKCEWSCDCYDLFSLMEITRILQIHPFPSVSLTWVHTHPLYSLNISGRGEDWGNYMVIVYTDKNIKRSPLMALHSRYKVLYEWTGSFIK